MNLPQIKSRGSLTEKTYNTLKRAILDLDLKPGQLLTEEELSEQLGVSRTPLRAALNKLEYENLIKITPGRGTYVAELSLEYMEDIFDVREAVDMLSVRLAAERKTDEDIKEMDYLVEQQELLLKDKEFDVKQFIKLDIDFHCIISKAANNKVLERLTLQLVESYNRYILAAPFLDRASTIVSEHKQIIKAIKESNGEEAARIVQNHVNDIRESLKERIKKIL